MRIERGKEQLEADIPIELPKDEPELERYFNVQEVWPGLHTWTNPDNGFTVARVHYSVDPAKRTPEWKKEARRGVTWSEWMREYEIVSSSFEGTPVYGDDFSRAYHVSKEPLVWSARHPIIRGWDFGLGAGGMACVIAQLLQGGRLFVYREITASDTDLEHFAPEVSRLCSDWFPNAVAWFDIIDPTGFNRSQLNKKRSCAVVLRENLMDPIPGIASQVIRRKAVSDFLSSNKRGLPKFVVDSACEMLVAGFEGGYHYAKQKDGQLKEEPEKNEYSHPHDALQMVCCKVKVLALDKPPQISFGQASYGFGKAVPVGEPTRRYA